MFVRRLRTETDITMQTHHMTTREGERLCLMVGDDGYRHLFTYDGGDLDIPAWEIVLDPDEADLLAGLLRVDQLIGERRR